MLLDSEFMSKYSQLLPTKTSKKPQSKNPPKSTKHIVHYDSHFFDDLKVVLFPGDTNTIKINGFKYTRYELMQSLERFFRTVCNKDDRIPDNGDNDSMFEYYIFNGGVEPQKFPIFQGKKMPYLTKFYDLLYWIVSPLLGDDNYITAMNGKKTKKQYYPYQDAIKQFTDDLTIYNDSKSPLISPVSMKSVYGDTDGYDQTVKLGWESTSHTRSSSQVQHFKTNSIRSITRIRNHTQSAPNTSTLEKLNSVPRLKSASRLLLKNVEPVVYKGPSDSSSPSLQRAHTKSKSRNSSVPTQQTRSSLTISPTDNNSSIPRFASDQHLSDSRTKSTINARLSLGNMDHMVPRASESPSHHQSNDVQHTSTHIRNLARSASMNDPLEQMHSKPRTKSAPSTFATEGYKPIIITSPTSDSIDGLNSKLFRQDKMGLHGALKQHLHGKRINNDRVISVLNKASPSTQTRFKRYDTKKALPTMYRKHHPRKKINREEIKKSITDGTHKKTKPKSKLGKSSTQTSYLSMENLPVR